jgi:hypothetical protein
VNPAGRGASVYQAMNSSNPRLYTLRVIGEETLSSTSAFNLRHSEVLSATTRAFIVKSFAARYLAISGANRTLALVGGRHQLKHSTGVDLNGMTSGMRITGGIHKRAPDVD